VGGSFLHQGKKERKAQEKKVTQKEHLIAK
jgi:hypothetical protein